MSVEMEKKKMAEEVWMDYFNEYLFEHGLIDDAEQAEDQDHHNGKEILIHI